MVVVRLVDVREVREIVLGGVMVCSPVNIGCVPLELYIGGRRCRRRIDDDRDGRMVGAREAKEVNIHAEEMRMGCNSQVKHRITTSGYTNVIDVVEDGERVGVEGRCQSRGTADGLDPITTKIRVTSVEITHE